MHENIFFSFISHTTYIHTYLLVHLYAIYIMLKKVCIGKVVQCKLHNVYRKIMFHKQEYLYAYYDDIFSSLFSFNNIYVVLDVDISLVI